MAELLAQAVKWSNDNQGVVSIVIFGVTMAFGWVSGIFSSLRRKPKFKIGLIDGPTFCCTFLTGNTKDGHPSHRTGIALYMDVANIGSAASSIANVSVGYHWHVQPYSLVWLRYGVGWFWLRNQVAALADFQGKIGESTKVYPFLTQKSSLSSVKGKTYLQPGQSTNGVVYFEQAESWGGCFPSPRKGSIRIKVAIDDVYGKRHTAIFRIPMVSMEYARTYNPSFGKTLAELHGQPLPFDKSAAEPPVPTESASNVDAPDSAEN